MKIREWRHKRIGLLALILFCIPVLVFAYTVDNLDPLDQTDLNITYSSAGGNTDYYFELPLNSTVNSATLDIRGWNIIADTEDDTEDLFSGNIYLDNAADCHDQNWNTFAQGNHNTYQGVAEENFTVPSGVVTATWVAKMENPGAATKYSYAYCLNQSAYGWSWYLVQGWWRKDPATTETNVLPADCIGDSVVAMRTTVPKEAAGVHKYYEGKVIWNDGLVAAYPTDPLLDVSNDGDAEWSYDGEHKSVNTTADFASELNDYLDSCGDDPCQIPANFTINASGGIFQINNIAIDYDLPPYIVAFNSSPTEPDLYNATRLTAEADDDDGYIQNISFTVRHPDGYDVVSYQNGSNTSGIFTMDLADAFTLNKTGVWNYSALIYDNDSLTYEYNWTYNSTLGFNYALNESSWVFAQVPADAAQGYAYLMVNASTDGNAYNTVDISVNGTELSNTSKFWVTYTTEPGNITGAKKFREFLVNITAIPGNVSDGVYNGNLVFNRTNDQRIEFIPVTITISGTAGNPVLSLASYTTSMENNIPHSWTFDVTNDGGTASLVGCNVTFTGSMSAHTTVSNGDNFDLAIGNDRTIMITHAATAPVGTYADGDVLVNCTAAPGSSGYIEKHVTPVSITVTEYTGDAGGTTGGGGGGSEEEKRICNLGELPEEIILTRGNYIESVKLTNYETDSVRYDGKISKPSLVYNDASPYLEVRNSAGILGADSTAEIILVFNHAEFPEEDSENYKAIFTIESDICEDVEIPVYLEKKSTIVLPASFEEALTEYTDFLQSTAFNIGTFAVEYWMILVGIWCVITPVLFLVWKASPEEVLWRIVRSGALGTFVSLAISYGLMFMI